MTAVSLSSFSTRGAILLINAILFLTAPGLLRAEDRLQLDAFIASAAAEENTGTLWPGSRNSASVFGFPQDLMDLPRSVTLITPEHLRLSGVRDFSGLDRLAVGAERPNYYGLAGAPVLRGDLAGTFFNGLQRVFQRNEMPMSFGSLEGMDVVRGPAPAHFGPTQAGGFVNFLPKSPYYDRARGSVQMTAGSHGLWRLQLDQGAPIIVAGRPAAYRLSATGQKAGAFHRQVRNDFVSVYAAAAVRVREGVTLFTGGEFYRYLTNENAGWNRVTQELIDTSLYIVGEPADRTSAAAGGYVLPSDIPFVVVPAGPGRQPAAAGAALIPPAGFAESLPEDLRRLLGPDGEYTAAYLDAGGPVAKIRLDPRTVLSDPDDRAHASNLLWFADWTDRSRPGRTLVLKALVDRVRTSKYSSYGYALDMEQRVAEFNASLFLDEAGPFGRTIVGFSLRSGVAEELVDFQAEPFSRRDLSRPEPSPNSIVLAGGLRPESGDTRNFWSKGLATTLEQAALFATTHWPAGNSAGLHASARAEGARFRGRIPLEQERNPLRGTRIAPGGKNYGSIGLNPYWKPGRRSILHATLQLGTALNPAQAGNVSSEANFGRTEFAEIGAKATFFDDTLFVAAAAYRSRLSRFNNITNNPYGLKSYGTEIELAWRPHPRFSLTAHAAARRTVQTNSPGFRFQATQEYYLPLVAGGLYAGGPANATLLEANNPGRRFPGSPERTAQLHARVVLAKGVSFHLGPALKSAWWLNFEHTLRIPSSIVWNGGLEWKRGRLGLRIDATNLFAERTFLGSDPTFASNAIVTPAPGREARLTVEWNF